MSDKPIIRVSSSGQIGIAFGKDFWVRRHGEWCSHPIYGRMYKYAPRDVMDLYSKAVKSALSLNGPNGPSEEDYPPIVDLS